MDWFEMLDKAKANGLEYANNGIAGGQKSPEDSPLSGEWAGAPTPKDIVADLGGDIEKLEHFEVEDICSHWEDGYNAAPWPEPEDDDEDDEPRGMSRIQEEHEYRFGDDRL